MMNPETKNSEICKMFTGIIEKTGIILEVFEKQLNKEFYISSPLTVQLQVDQSVSHNGVCLTVDQVMPEYHRVTAIDETLKKTNLDSWKAGDTVNLERSMLMNGRLDGHVVQGHVDTVAICESKTEHPGSYVYTFGFPTEFADLIVEKGSICLNGISLTAFDVSDNSFSVAIIPYTYDYTNISGINKGSSVNVEFDIFGKYARRIIRLSARITA